MAFVVITSGGAPAQGQQQPSAPTAGVPTPDIIPQPNSGHVPREAGDRGGALQLAVLVLVVAAIGGVAVHLARESRRSSPQ